MEVVLVVPGTMLPVLPRSMASTLAPALMVPASFLAGRDTSPATSASAGSHASALHLAWRPRVSASRRQAELLANGAEYPVLPIQVAAVNAPSPAIACGVHYNARINGIVDMLERMVHHGSRGCEKNTGHIANILVTLP